MRRFFVDYIIEPTAETLIIQDNLHRHLSKVLRIKAGEKIVVADYSGNEFEAEVISMTPDATTVTLARIAAVEKVTEKDLKITLLQALPKGDKMELIVQKSTELGVAAFVPFVGHRSIPRLSPQKEQERVNRWQKIALEAARQSRRTQVPHVSPICSFEQAVQDSQQLVKLLLWEEEKSMQLKDFLATTDLPRDVAILIGPEGGFTREEVEKATYHGFTPVTLGSRILRTETAGIAVVAILQYVWGDLG